MARRGALGGTPSVVLSVIVAVLLGAGVLAATQTGEQTDALVATSSAPATTTVLPPTTAPPTTTTSTTAAPFAGAVFIDGRWALDTGFRPFASAGGVVLHYPTAHVERVGLHESKLAGARPIEGVPGSGEIVDLPSRERLTPGRTAADVLSDPNGEVRAPVTGRIKRGGTYTLYCKHTDSFLVIEPDAHPGWEVKLLHISGLSVRVGQRVEAGVTRVAAHPTRLPFASQVEDVSAQPGWPHVHVEVVDPTIKNPPGVGGGSCS